MKPPHPAETRETLAGLVERVTFHNEESGFAVLRVKARGKRDLMTVVGHAAVISAGEFVQASGTWTNDRQHGLQFRAAFLKAMPPTTADGIEKYLGSGMIRGIGPVYSVMPPHDICAAFRTQYQTLVSYRRLPNISHSFTLMWMLDHRFRNVRSAVVKGGVKPIKECLVMTPALANGWRQRDAAEHTGVSQSDWANT